MSLQFSNEMVMRADCLDRPDPQGAFKVDPCFSWLAKRYTNGWQSHAIKLSTI
jgi:hypothetical protein